MKYFVIYLIIVNAISFLLFGIDKQKAKKNQWRITEKVLIGSAVIGGSIGAFLGMKVFRHKTQKLKFSMGIPCIFLLQIAAVVYISTKI